MPHYYVHETFFRPAEHGREASYLPADLVNGLSRLLARAEREHLFVPIRAMQYQAIVEREEVVFVDGQGGYAYQDGVGGRVIQLAWRPQRTAERTSLDRPVPCEILYYFADLRPIHQRLVGTLRHIVAESLRRDQPPPSGAGRIVPFRPRTESN